MAGSDATETRREFLRLAGAAALAGGAAPRLRTEDVPSPPVKSPRLRPGDVVGLVAPAGANFLSVDIEIAQEVTRALGLEPRLGNHVRDRHGYLAGRDEDRAADIGRFFANPGVKAVLAIRGGWGSLTLEEVLDEHVRPLGVPAYAGAMIGHQERQFTVPIGIEAEIDAEAGTIAMLEPAVV